MVQPPVLITAINTAAPDAKYRAELTDEEKLSLPALQSKIAANATNVEDVVALFGEMSDFARTLQSDRWINIANDQIGFDASQCVLYRLDIDEDV